MLISEDTNTLDYYMDIESGELEFQTLWLRHFRYTVSVLHRFIRGYEDIGDHKQQVANEVNTLFTACCLRSAEEAKIVWEQPLTVFADNMEKIRELMTVVQSHVQVFKDPDNDMKFIAKPMFYETAEHNQALRSLHVTGYSADACQLLLSILILYHFRFHRAYIVT